MIGVLPETLIIGEDEFSIRSDYRNILRVFEVFSDPELDPAEKWIVTIYLLFESFSSIDDVLDNIQKGFDINEAIHKIEWFISAGGPEKEILEKPVYSWKKDEQMIFSAVNKVAGKETRELPYLHWWTFLGYFNEIGEGTFSFVVNIRNKLNRGKKLEKDEREFLNRNKELIKLERPKSKEEMKKEEEVKKLLNEVFG